MASAVIGSLRVDLSMNSAQFQKGAKQAQSTLGTLGNSIKQFAIGAAAALSFGAVTRAISNVIDRADDMGKAAQKIGFSTEALSRLEYAAKLADVSMESLQTGLGKLSKGMADIAAGKSNDFSKALNRIGVSALNSNGTLRDGEQVYLDIADKLSKMKDGADKTALSLIFFGKSGKDQIPLLNAGRDGIKQMGDEAERLGLVIDTKTSKAAEQFNDNMTRLNASLHGLLTKVIVPLIPKLAELSDAFVVFATTDLNSFLDTTRRELEAIKTVAQKIIGLFKSAAPTTNQITFRGRTGTILGQSATPDRPAGGPSGRAPLNLRSTATSTANLPALPETIKPPSPAVRDGVKEITEEMRQSAYEARQLNLQTLKLSETVPAAAEATSSLGSAFADVFAGTVQSALSSAIDGTFKLQDAVKGLINSLANAAIQNLFSSLSGGTAGTAGGGLFAGLGKLFGFARGGTIFPGGSGGIDSQLVAFRKSPNERVDITKPGQRLDRGSGGRGDTYIDARGADPGQVALLRAEMRDMQSGLDRRIVTTVAHRKNQDPRFVR